MNPEDIQQLEALTRSVYASTSQDERNQAAQTLVNLLEHPNAASLLPQIFTATSLPELSYLALNSLKKVLALRWNSFVSPAEKLNQYNTLVSAMLERSSQMPPYIANTLAQTISRYARMGWLEDEAYRTVVRVLTDAAAKDSYFCGLALNFFKELIAEVVEPIKSRPLSAHRKMAISFRDTALFEIFRFTHFLIGKYAELSTQLRLSTLQVFASCLSYDFLGISSDESSEDSVCVQIPLPWAPLIQDDLLIKAVEMCVIQASDEELSAALRVLNHLGAVRRSLFGTREGKAVYLEKFLQATTSVLINKKFEIPERFEVAQLLKRFVQNFQLREIGEIPMFEAWLGTIERYTVEAYTFEEAVESTYVSMMYFWSYLSYEANNQQPLISKAVGATVERLLKIYINNTLEMLSTEHLEEQVMSSDNDLLDHLEHIANCCILHYDQIMPELHARLNERIAAFQANISGDNPRLDAQLSWLVYIVGALVGLREKKACKDSESLDSTAIQLVFQMVTLTDSRIQMSGKTSATLEAALTYFFNCLRKAYINTPNELSWYFFEPENPPTLNEERLNNALTVIVDKLLRNLSMFANHKPLQTASMELLLELARGYYSNKLLAKLDISKELMTRYRNINLSPEPRLRKHFYTALGHLWTNEEIDASLTQFLAPMAVAISEVIQSQNAASYILTFRELEGICLALQSQRQFLEFYEWFAEGPIQLVASSLETTDFNLMLALLSFFRELTQARNTRIRFDNASSHGVILFKTVARVIVSYGRHLLERAEGLTEQKFKLMYKILAILTNVLSGSYVPFGVFKVYGDSCFTDSLTVAYALLRSVDPSELTTYSKLQEQVFEFIEHVHKNCLSLVFTALPTSAFLTSVDAICTGIRLDNIKSCLNCANSVQYLCEFVIKQMQKNSEEYQGIHRILAERPNVFTELLRAVLEVVMTEDTNYMWTLSKPLLGLIIVSEHQFEELKLYLINSITQDQERVGGYLSAFDMLMKGISRGMDIKNKDRFTKNFSDFRQAINALS
mmetsp:Transcript_27201/g.48856  ORF Transcript_27201/g.48856 Transcript_27201/m.48856 type:complete len:1023 (+) Transcript_27201:931-3999(+)